jgi:UDP-N-acetylmuramate dehydrogenase
VTGDDVPRAALEALAAQLGSAARWSEPLAPHTSMRVGGAADLFLPARRNEQIVAGLQAAYRLGVPCRVIGGASNLLVADGGIAGLVIKSLVQGVRYVPHPTEPGRVTAVAAAGCLFASLARDCARRGLAGLVWASNVPGTVGAAVVNNAGAFGSATAEVLERALLVDAAGQTRYVTAADLAMGYRTTRLKRREIQGVVLAVELRLQVGDAASLLAELQQVREQRRRTQPAGFSVGSTFMNPPGDAAGRLIEAAGLKGRRVAAARQFSAEPRGRHGRGRVHLDAPDPGGGVRARGRVAAARGAASRPLGRGAACRVCRAIAQRRGTRGGRGPGVCSAGRRPGRSGRGLGRCGWRGAC